MSLIRKKGFFRWGKGKPRAQFEGRALEVVVVDDLPHIAAAAHQWGSKRRLSEAAAHPSTELKRSDACAPPCQPALIREAEHNDNAGGPAQGAASPKGAASANTNATDRGLEPAPVGTEDATGVATDAADCGASTPHV